MEQITALCGDEEPSHSGSQSHGACGTRLLRQTSTNPLPLQSGDAVFVITDGGDNSKPHPVTRSLRRRLSKSGIRSFRIRAASRATPRTEEEREGPNQTIRAVARTNRWWTRFHYWQSKSERSAGSSGHNRSILDGSRSTLSCGDRVSRSHTDIWKTQGRNSRERHR